MYVRYDDVFANYISYTRLDETRYTWNRVRIVTLQTRRQE